MNTKGIGLGLYISKMIIENFDGGIALESELGKGSSFTFVIPLEEFCEEDYVGESRCKSPHARKYR